jgi:FlaA1/EpsC-like NDP-sugar epimerase
VQQTVTVPNRSVAAAGPIDPEYEANRSRRRLGCITDQVILVTGGTSGLGRRLVGKLVAAGRP